MILVLNTGGSVVSQAFAHQWELADLHVESRHLIPSDADVLPRAVFVGEQVGLQPVALQAAAWPTVVVDVLDTFQSTKKTPQKPQVGLCEVKRHGYDADFYSA